MFLWHCIACKSELAAVASYFISSLSFFLYSLPLSLYYRSSNRDPGARAADSLSPKDHEGVFSLLCKFVFIQSGGQKNPLFGIGLL